MYSAYIYIASLVDQGFFISDDKLSYIINKIKSYNNGIIHEEVVIDKCSDYVNDNIEN